MTLYVSKLGDNSDGSSWQKAFHKIQAALLAVPDDQGGHQIIIRPDTYVEANLYSLHKGAPGAYNLIRGDYDGKLGSGTTGWVALDCSAPGVAVRMDPDPKKGGNWKIVQSDAPESGYKSVDWWSNFGAPPGTFSNHNFDRWIFRHLYLAGGEGGFGLTVEGDTPCTLVAEDCVSIGRFSGAALAGGVGRKDEPVRFRRCHLMNLDWWGDAGAAYVRAHHPSPPEYPDAVFEDCTLVGPDNALQVGYPGFNLYTRVKFKDSRLITLNFSQARGTPGSGIICCDIDGSRLHIDFEDCTLIGYGLFGKSGMKVNRTQGAGKGEPSFSLKGTVRAYVHYRQPLPEGFERLGLWPLETFNWIAPPKPGRAGAATSK